MLALPRTSLVLSMSMMAICAGTFTQPTMCDIVEFQHSSAIRSFFSLELCCAIRNNILVAVHDFRNTETSSSKNRRKVMKMMITKTVLCICQGKLLEL
jgi:hypothetical protein